MCLEATTLGVLLTGSDRGPPDGTFFSCAARRSHRTMASRFMAAEPGLPAAERLRGKALSVHVFHSVVKTVFTVFARQS